MASQATDVHEELTRDHALSALTAGLWVLGIAGLAVAADVALPRTPSHLAILGILALGGLVTESFAVRVGTRNETEVSAGGIVIILAARERRIRSTLTAGLRHLLRRRERHYGP